MITRVLVVFLFALCAFVLGGNPDSQRPTHSELKKNEINSVLADIKRVIATPRPRPTTRAPTTTKKPATTTTQPPAKKDTDKPEFVLPILATSYKQLPDSWNGVVGPHADNKVSVKNFTSIKGIPSSSCQIDCLSTVSRCDGNKSMVPIFSDCDVQYYNYGTEAKYGCFSTETIMETQAEIVFDICQRYNKCKVIYKPDDLVGTLRKAKGANSKGNKAMTMAVSQWGKSAFWAARSGDRTKFNERTAAAVAAVAEQANEAAKEAIENGQDPKAAVRQVIDNAATLFAESASNLAAKVAVKNAAYKAYEKAVHEKKKSDEVKRQLKLSYASSYAVKEGRTSYSTSSSGYLKPTFKLSEREKAVGRDFAKAIADAAEHAKKFERSQHREKAKKARDILKRRDLRGLVLRR